MTPIGTFYSSHKEKGQTPRQPGLDDSSGIIKLLPGHNYEQALQDLSTFDRIWILFLFDRNPNWKPMVKPPRSSSKKGLFATRSPHRPNPIGLSNVELISIDGLTLQIGSNDLLDSTPILDIKPYIPEIDSHPTASSGWLPPQAPPLTIIWSPLAIKQATQILSLGGPDLQTLARFEENSRLTPTILAYKTWRLHYTQKENKITIQEIRSGYSAEELEKDDDPWGDKELHRKFA